jgi:D-3-phosphoglycerate dehydrogenase
MAMQKSVPRVVVTDYTFDSLDVERGILEPLGCDIVAWKKAGTPAELAEHVRGADHIITQFAPLTADIIAAMDRARVIARYGVGVDNVDLEAARARGIPVCNVPDYCMDEVADHTLALLLALTRQVVPHARACKAGEWKLAAPMAAMKALRDLTVGVVGFGRIGREVVHRLRAFKCPILVHDPVVPAAEIERSGCRAAGFEELLEKSDAVTLHCPSTARTRRMIRGETIARMKQGAILINVGRGDLVDSMDLVSALQEGKLAAAGLDVFSSEPIPADHPILRLDNVVLSAHVASVSVRAVRTLRATTAEIVARSIRGEALPNVVNGV